MIKELKPFLQHTAISILISPLKDNPDRFHAMIIAKPRKKIADAEMAKKLSMPIHAYGTAEELDQHLSSELIVAQVSNRNQAIIKMQGFEAATKEAAGEKGPVAKEKRGAKTKAPKEGNPAVAPGDGGKPMLMRFMMTMTEIEDLRKRADDGWKEQVIAKAGEFRDNAKAAMAENPLSEAMTKRAKEVRAIFAEASQTTIA